MLIDFGDFLYCNKTLPPSGYVEEWWKKELQTLFQKNSVQIIKGCKSDNLLAEKIEGFVLDPFVNKPTVKDAVA